MKSLFKFLFFISVTLSQVGSAFPEMTRHGYANCIACHVAANGGGILTPYGRQLSQEVLSNLGQGEKEPSFAHGLIKLPGWLNLGGDVRAVQTYVNTPTREAARLIFMQADLESALAVQKFQWVATVGRQEPTTLNPSGGLLFSRRHYLAYRPTDSLSLRAGKFMYAYGINTADHMIATKRELRWDEGSETYNLEAAWLGENVDVFATLSFGRPDDSQLKREKGVALRSSAFLWESSKVGGSYFYGANNDGSRHVFGPYAILGISSKVFLLTEIDLQNSRSSTTSSRWGIVDYLKVDYEFVKGLHVFVTQELSKLNFSDSKSLLAAYGAGLQFFPRPHFEIAGMWQKRQQLTASSDYTDFAWLLFHYYL